MVKKFACLSHKKKKLVTKNKKKKNFFILTGRVSVKILGIDEKKIIFCIDQ